MVSSSTVESGAISTVESGAITITTILLVIGRLVDVRGVHPLELFTRRVVALPTRKRIDDIFRRRGCWLCHNGQG
jgi:hypothetical protein